MPGLRFSVFCCCLCISLKICAQQEPQYALSQFNHLIVNPAYTGLRSGTSVFLQSRQQWIGNLGPLGPKTFAFSAHGSKKSMGVGMHVLADQIGARKKVQYGLNLAYHLKLNSRSLLSFGLSAAAKQYQFKRPDYFFKIDEPVPSSFDTRQMLNIDGGIYYKSNRTFLSLSVTQLNAGRVTLQQDAKVVPLTYILEPHYIVMAGRAFILSEQVVLSPVVQMRYTRSSWIADIQLHAMYGKRLAAGAYYRYDNAFGVLVQYLSSKGLRMGYCFELNPMRSKYLGTTHELSLGIDLGTLKSINASDGGKIRASIPRFL